MVLARLQLALAAALGLVAVALGAVLLLGSGKDAGAGGGQTAAFTIGPEGLAGAVSPPGARPVGFDLRDQDGKPVSLGDLRGSITVLTFLYSTCEDTCPVTASQVLGALDDLGPDARAVKALAISVDPADDTPARARKFLLDRRLTGRMRFLLGPRSALKPVWDGYGIQEQGPDFEHSARVVILDREGRQRVAFPIDQLTPDALANDLRVLQREP